MKTLGCLLLGGILAGCESRPVVQDTGAAVATAPLAAPVAAAPPAFLPDSAKLKAARAEDDTLAALRREKLRPGQLGYHRYRGQVGGRPVVLHLMVARLYAGATADCTGSSYELPRRPEHRLEVRRFWPGQPLRLVEADTSGQLATWLTDQSLGPVLTGRWRAAGSAQTQPFTLREDYQGGLRYELLTVAQEGRPIPPEAGDTLHAPFTPSYERTYLHLLGPDTLRPAVRRLQPPAPARLRADIRARLRIPGDYSECQDTETTAVLLNDFGLLSCANYYSSYMHRAAHPQHETTFTNYDVRTARPMTYAALFRAGYAPVLLQLLVRHLDARYLQKGQEWRSESREDCVRQLQLPETFGLTPDGWLVELTLGVMGPTEVLVPYAELLPLLRPGSPLARMVRERGYRPGPAAPARL